MQKLRKKFRMFLIWVRENVVFNFLLELVRGRVAEEDWTVASMVEDGAPMRMPWPPWARR